MSSNVNIAHKATSGRRGPDATLVKTALDAQADRITAAEALFAGEPRTTSLTAGTTITDSTTETITKTVTIPLAALRAGTRVSVFARSLVAGVDSTPTLRTALRLVNASGQSLCDSGAVASVAGSVGVARADILIHGTPGASTRIYWNGHAQQVATAPVFTQGSVANQDLSAGLVVCCTLKWSAAHADNQAAGTELTYELTQPAA
jgi:hypothetical protein